MGDKGCGTTVTGQTDFVFGANFEITATELNPAGYIYNLCYNCEVKPIDFPMSTFSRNIII